METTITTTVCSSCGQEIQHGDWPFCPHGSTRPEWAQRFDPLVIHRDPTTGQISYPGSANDPVPHGYERVELRTIREADAFCKERSVELNAERRMNLHAEQTYWDERTKDRREKIRAIIEKRGYSGRYFDAISKMVDAKREKKMKELNGREVHFFSDVFSRDSSNRNPHSSPDTGWKNRKG